MAVISKLLRVFCVMIIKDIEYSLDKMISDIKGLEVYLQAT